MIKNIIVILVGLIIFLIGYYLKDSNTEKDSINPLLNLAGRIIGIAAVIIGFLLLIFT